MISFNNFLINTLALSARGENGSLEVCAVHASLETENEADKRNERTKSEVPGQSSGLLTNGNLERFESLR